ncbi:MAG: Unknown protein [uncultured Sulfurovum sp.]|uniref:Uncharacterized protein n=1 Tax=uncultured Sulfurovum sp. TaxID=269237 RepID=A0A6S6TSS0_9BACT|nr:MAG: Unknown protein [uncultured Sulfurovum sp.]
MKKITFKIASRRLEVDLEDDFAQYIFDDLEYNNVNLDEEIDIRQLLQLYLKSMHKEFRSEKQIKTLLNQLKE